MTNAADDPRRRFPRSRSFWKGTVIFPGGLRSVGCVVRDFSEAGARIDCAGIMDIPDKFQLHIPQRSQTYDCKVAWRRGGEFGVEFKTEAATSVDAIALSIKALQDQNRRLMARLAERSTD